MKPIAGRRTRSGGKRAFTLVELVVVIGMVGLAAMMLVPALARTRTSSPAIQCLNNLNQLQRAGAMYAADNNGRLVPNLGGFSVSSTRWASGWLDWNNSPANTNLQYLSGTALGPYMAKALQSYKCPADEVPAQNGPRVRSYSMSAFVGGTLEQDLYGYASYRVFLRDTDFAVPGAANTIVLADEHPDSINDELLAVRMPPSTLWPAAAPWEDVPASRHNGSGAFSFADGHAAVHKWLDATTKAPVLKTSSCSAYGKVSPNDGQWMVAHASAPL